MFQLSRTVDRRDLRRGFHVVNARRESKRQEYRKLVKAFKAAGWAADVAKSFALDCIKRGAN